MNEKELALSLSKGFVSLIIIVIVTLAISAGVGGFLVWHESKTSSFEKTEGAAGPIEPTSSPTPSTRLLKHKTQLEETKKALMMLFPC